MSTPDELVAEHANLLRERAGLQKLCLDEWTTMPAQVARQRQKRLWAIRDRLEDIRRSKSFRQPGS